MAQTRILYIEDYPVVQFMYVEILKKHFEVAVASDGKEALEMTKQTVYDVILLDLLLPQMSGIEFLRAYQQNAAIDKSKTRLVVLSDFDNQETRKEVYDLGVKNFWIKVETTPHILVEKINELLNSTG